MLKKVGIALSAEVIEFASDAPSEPSESESKSRALKMKGVASRLLERPPSDGMSTGGGDSDGENLSGGEVLDAVRDALGATASVANGWWKKTRKSKGGGRFLGDSKVSQTIISTVCLDSRTSSRIPLALTDE